VGSVLQLDKSKNEKPFKMGEPSSKTGSIRLKRKET
jgi:hypothetical protein